MQIAQIHHRIGSGWMQPLPVELDGPRTLVLAFGPRCTLDDPQALQELAAAFPGSVLMGCSTAGEIAAAQVDDAGLCVSIARFDAVALQRASTELAGAGDSRAAGARLAAQLPAAGLRAVFVLSPGVDINGAALVDGLSAGLPAQVSVSGGFAGDGSRFERTWVLDDGMPRERCVTAVGLYGPALRIGHGCEGGWFEFGPGRTITRAAGNVLYELDGRPALALYKHYLGDLASQLPGSALLFPLSVRVQDGGSAPVVRTILGLDEAAQSLTFAADMPEGALARLMRTSVDRLVASADGAAVQAMRGAAPEAARPVLAVSVSCIGRRLVMGERTDEEVEAVALRLPPGSVHAGFYSYGEIAPTRGRAGAGLHNQTMTLTILSEA